MLSEKNILLLKQKGISEAELNKQLKQFTSGFPYISLEKPAIIGDGIFRYTKAQQEEFIKQYENALNRGIEVKKFVPASGAASRMFKDLYEYVESSTENFEYPKAIAEFLAGKEKFAFWDDLQIHLSKGGKEITNKDLIKGLLNSDGLNYGNSPKGILKFHKYPTKSKTPVAEHLTEGAQYAKCHTKAVSIHFTVSPEHKMLFESAVSNCKNELEKEFNVQFDITFSFQKSSTDTVAVTPSNEPFLKENGELLFRPSGHGALIENLNDLDADVIFIKNIDNVVIDDLIGDTIIYKKVLAGALLEMQAEIFSTLKALEFDTFSGNKINDVIMNIQKRWAIKFPENISTLSDKEKKALLQQELSKPIRVCGMVKNEGEAGGGPFWCKSKDGSVALQIVEGSQIDPKNSTQQEILKSSTHFNPVDLVVATKNYKGEKFNLLNFVDPEAGFISEKSQNGKPLKAMELPGLWNGAMSNWITVFVEVPIITFNPVKTINDLLRKTHQML